MNHRDAETQRRRKRDNGKFKVLFRDIFISRYQFFVFSCLALCLCVSVVNLSCSTKPTDMRSLVPGETLIYLETNDLAAALQPIVDSKPFKDATKAKPDFSALKGVQLAVAVTGFETTEQKLTDEHSIGNVQPRFVAIADTHAWNYQAVAFADQKLGQFVTDNYGADVTQDQADKNGGKYFTWSSNDGRKAYAQVIDSVIYFGNDETALDKCLAVRRGDADSIGKSGRVLPTDPTTLASGYVTTDGVAQIAGIVGLRVAFEASDQSEIQSAIIGILPQLIRNSITEVTWTARKTDKGIEDRWEFATPTEIGSVLSETFAVGEDSTQASVVNNTIIAQLPESVATATRYNLKNPQLAWRSVLLLVQRNLNVIDAKIISVFAGLLFEPYGISDPELFLSSFSNKNQKSLNIVTTRLDAQDGSVVIAALGDANLVRKSLSPDLKPPRQLVEGGLNTWSTGEGDVQVAFDQDMIKIGSKEDLMKINGMRLGELSDIRSEPLRRLALSRAPIATVGQDSASVIPTVEMLASEARADTRSVSTFMTETRFTKTGIERRTISDFGVIGFILAQLNAE